MGGFLSLRLPLSSDGRLWNTATLCTTSLLLPLGSASMCVGHPGLIALCPFSFPSEVCTPTLHCYYIRWGCSQCQTVCSCLCPSFVLSPLLTPVLLLSCLSCSLPYACLQMSQCVDLRHVCVFSRESFVEL